MSSRLAFQRMVEINECVLPFGTVSQSQPSATRQAVGAPMKVVQHLPFRPCFITRICAANPAQPSDQIHKAEIVCPFERSLAGAVGAGRPAGTSCPAPREIFRTFYLHIVVNSNCPQTRSPCRATPRTPSTPSVAPSSLLCFAGGPPWESLEQNRIPAERSGEIHASEFSD